MWDHQKHFLRKKTGRILLTLLWKGVSFLEVTQWGIILGRIEASLLGIEPGRQKIEIVTEIVFNLIHESDYYKNKL